MFATLDPTSRRLRFPREREVIVTDTVGFIRDLPRELVVAFRATLEEISEANLLLHVVDASAADLERRIEAVREVLDEIDDGRTPELLVFNQIDKLPPDVGKSIAARHGGVAVSALERTGFGGLLARADAILWEDGEEAFEEGRRRPLALAAQGG
jgi:GTP-binding protein HflX